MPIEGTGGGDAAVPATGGGGGVSAESAAHAAASATTTAAPRTAAVLYTSTPPTARVEGAQRALLALLHARGLEVVLLDGGEPGVRDVRNAVWAVAGTPTGSYPLLLTRTAAPAGGSGAAPTGVRVVPAAPQPSSQPSSQAPSSVPSVTAAAQHHNRAGSGPTGQVRRQRGWWRWVSVARVHSCRCDSPPRALSLPPASYTLPSFLPPRSWCWRPTATRTRSPPTGRRWR
jgi:hypothetical protein